MKTTPLLNVLLVQHMDVPRVPKVLMLDKCDKLDSYILLPGDLLDANSINNIKDDLTGEIDTVNTKLSNHISDSHCHTTSTEKNYWNNKLDAAEFNTTIAALQSQIPLNPITSANLADALEALGLLDANHNPTGGDTGLHNYLEEGDFLGTINGIRFAQGEDITIPVGSDPSTWTDEIWENIYNYIDEHYDGSTPGKSYKITGLNFNTSTRKLSITQQNNNDTLEVTIPGGSSSDASTFSYTPNITATSLNSYKIGTITYNGTSYTVYGKTGGGSDGIGYATDDTVGGFLTGYEQNGKNYPVRLSNGRAYVNVPWGDVEGSTGYWEIIFKAVVGSDMPSLPEDGSNDLDGWSHSAENNDGSKTVWMADRWVNGRGEAGQWQGPWRISGSNGQDGQDGQDGENGVDGTEYEYIYKLTATEQAPELDTTTIHNEDDYVPTSQGWSNNPHGVNRSMRYEWMALRKKIDGTWTAFVGPILWSAYGRNGTDGDGIEYIFYLDATGEKTFPTNSSDNPITWTNDNGFQNREYIRSNSGWTDDPINMTERGSKQYVSVRKRYADFDGEDPYWHSYSLPALWAYYSKDGTIDDFDPTEIYDRIDEFNDVIDNLLTNIESVVLADVENTLTRADWIRNNFPTEELAHTSGWNDITGNFVSTVGYIDSNNSVTWSDFVQGVDTILSKVSAVIDNNNTIKSSVFNQALQGTNLYTYYANLNDDGEILKYLIAGFKTEATGTESSAAQYALASAANSKGIAALVNRVTTAEGKINAVLAGLEAKWSGTTSDIENIVDNRAGVVATSTANSAIASMFAEGTSGTNSEKLRATISTVVENDQSIISLIANRVDISGYLTGGSATFKGNVLAKSLSVLNGENLSIKFTTYLQDTDIDWSSYEGFSTSGLTSGDPVGLIYNNGTLKYFFDFAPVRNVDSAFDVLPTYDIRNNGANKISIDFGNVYYKVHSEDSTRDGKYVIAPRSGSALATTTEISGVDHCVRRGVVTALKYDSSSQKYYFASFTIWRKIRISSGEIQLLNQGYVTEGEVCGASITSYVATSPSGSIPANNIYETLTAQQPASNMVGGPYSIGYATPGTSSGAITLGLLQNALGGRTLINGNVFSSELPSTIGLQNAPEGFFFEEPEP